MPAQIRDETQDLSFEMFQDSVTVKWIKQLHVLKEKAIEGIRECFYISLVIMQYSFVHEE
jgi:hypothetical protein